MPTPSDPPKAGFIRIVAAVLAPLIVLATTYLNGMPVTGPW